MVQIIILAGGMGKRMQSTIPKVLVEFQKKPMLVHVIQQAVQLNPDKILIVVGKTTKDRIQQSVTKWFPHVPTIEYVLQETPLGTGHAVQCCVPHLNCSGDVIILSGDVPNIRAKTINDVFELNVMFDDNSSSKLMAFVPDNNYGYGRIVRAKTEFLYICEEKDCDEETGKIGVCNAGIYCIPADILKKYIFSISNDNAVGEYYLPDIFSVIQNENHKHIHVCMLPTNKNSEVMGVNTPEQLSMLEKKIA
jgi:bifunctional N-acetylglucosamine-1-phosphate-uridyltransferase/glucosamine-1-phosphate-acetyltransferase GlmU-like protein